MKQRESVVLCRFPMLGLVVVLSAMCSGIVTQAQEIMAVNQASVFSKDSTLISVDAKGGELKSVAQTGSSAGSRVASANIRPGGRVEVSGGTSAHLIISEAVTAHLEPRTQIEIPQRANDQKPTTSIKLLKGKMFITVDAAKLKMDGNVEFRLETPKSLLAVKGTKFVATTDEQADTVALIEGSIAVRDQATNEFVILRPGQSTTVSGQGELSIRRLTPDESNYSAVFDESKLAFVPYQIRTDIILTSAKILPIGKSREPIFPNWIEQPKVFQAKGMKFDGFPIKGIRADYVRSKEPHQDVFLSLEFRSQPQGVFPDNTIGMLVKARSAELVDQPFMTFRIFTETKGLLDQGGLVMSDPLAAPGAWQSSFYYFREYNALLENEAYRITHPVKMEIGWRKKKEWPDQFSIEIASIQIITLGGNKK